MAKAWNDKNKSNASDTTWFFQLRHTTGERRSLTLSKSDFPGIRAAQDEADRQMREWRGIGESTKIDRNQLLSTFGLSVIDTRTVGGKPGGEPISASTKDTYKTLWNAYVVPTIGGLKLKAIDKATVETAFNTMRTRFNLTTNSLASIAAVLRIVIASGNKGGVFSMDMLHGIDWPQHDKPLAQRREVAMTGDVIRNALERLTNPFDRLRFYAGTVLSLRAGEILAIRWTDFTPSVIPGYCATLRVQRTLSRDGGSTVVAERGKTASATRTVPVPDYMAADLKAWRDRQTEIRREAGLPVDGGDWFVLSNKRGEAGGRGNLLKWWNVRKAEGILPAQFTPHNMRHSFGSHMSDATNGVSPAQAKLMGHANVTVTATSYAQALGSGELKAADAFHAHMRSLIAPVAA